MKKTTLVNFRDFGGLQTPYGPFASGKLYRTAAFRPKNKADEAYIESMRLDSVIDLRTEAERTEKPDVLPAGVEYVIASVFEATDNAFAPTKNIMRRMVTMPEEDFIRIEKLVESCYREMPFSPVYGEIFRRMDEGKTIAFHCTAGKDRTGMGATIVELAFGRTFDECKREYLLSNELRKKDNEKLMRLLRLLGVKKYAREHILILMQTHEDLFTVAQNAILEKYGTVDEFLVKAHGITPERREKWRETYLQR